jgi:hypothetical protein
VRNGGPCGSSSRPMDCWLKTRRLSCHSSCWFWTTAVVSRSRLARCSTPTGHPCSPTRSQKDSPRSSLTSPRTPAIYTTRWELTLSQLSLCEWTTPPDPGLPDVDSHAIAQLTTSLDRALTGQGHRYRSQAGYRAWTADPEHPMVSRILHFHVR